MYAIPSPIGDDPSLQTVQFEIPWTDVFEGGLEAAEKAAPKPNDPDPMAFPRMPPYGHKPECIADMEADNEVCRQVHLSECWANVKVRFVQCEKGVPRDQRTRLIPYS